MSLICFLFATIISYPSFGQNRDPLQTQIVTKDLDNFWTAFEEAGQAFPASVFQQLYIDQESPGIKGFMKGRIIDAETLAGNVKSNIQYYGSIKPNLDSITGMRTKMLKSFVKLKELYADAVFPPVYFVIGNFNSGGTVSRHGLIIGAEMFGLPPHPNEELVQWIDQRTWLKTP